MSKLSTYRGKRDFARSTEPEGKIDVRHTAPSKLRFVVQRHHASRLHYDFRLEVDGVLKSWAIPKGPSLYPQDKRLAVEVEDHPIDYASFEGVIPKGNYGAGMVHIFDSGYYTFSDEKASSDFRKAYDKGTLKFKLHGNILRGEFSLVRIKGENGKTWLLIKKKDRYASEQRFDSEEYVSDDVREEAAYTRRAPSLKYAPMLASLSDSIPKGSHWRYEKKYDGYRVIAYVNPPAVYLYSRNGKSLNARYPTVVKELSRIDRTVWLDGEVVVEDVKGKAYFQQVGLGEPLEKGLRLRYYIFDLLKLDGEDTTAYALRERIDLLDLLFRRMQKSTVLQRVEIVHGASSDVTAHALTRQWEGILSKDLESVYLPGKRNSSWMKWKVRRSVDVLICGYTKPSGSRSHFGALVLGMFKSDKIVYVGNCGTGFDEKSLIRVFGSMKKHITAVKPFESDVRVTKEKDVTWLDPVIIVEVHFTEWTVDDKLRHPIFKGIRSDKDAYQTKEKKYDMENMPSIETIKVGRKAVQLTNLDKIYWPGDNYVKGQMLAYYDALAEYILPYLKNKPISMHRFPNGISAPSFFQKDVYTKHVPRWLKTVPIPTENNDKITDYIVCNDKATLLYMANLGSIEINPWLSTYQKPEFPVYAVLDLDPNGASFLKVIQVAQTAYEIFREMKIQPFLKTSGSTGLHIYIHVKKRYTFDVVRDFIQLLAQMVHERHPDITSLVRDPKKRKGLIYLDYLQNRRGQTIVAPYSLRPKAGATVSTPLFWDELSPQLRITDYTITTILKRIEKIDDPWKDIHHLGANLKLALTKFT